jgi:hypothetical protein
MNLNKINSMKANLHKMDSGYILSLNGDIDDPYGIVNKELAKDYGWYKLSKQNCDEIFGVVDVEKLAEKEVFQEYYDWGGEVFSEDYLISKRLHFIEGFNKAMELNKDKLFTLEDMQKAFELGHNGAADTYMLEKNEQEFEKLIQQPTEIDVEIEMNRVVDETKVIGVVKGIKGSGDKITTYKSSPKLDADGCLILRKL